MIEKTGDLFSTEARFIGQGVNCQGKMGSGIAVQFRERFPEMYEQYRLLCERGILRGGDVYPFAAEYGTILNIASQVLPGANASLLYLSQGLYKAAYMVGDNGPIAIPRIGAGIGGLDWEDVRRSILQVERNLGKPNLFEVWTLPS